MRRASVDALCEDTFDLLVIGGGIYGLMVTRDAALRGLRAALVECADFGGATSQNSLKLMHGGIRYVQHLDLRRLRASAREQAFWQRAAPELVRPLEFTIPLFGHGIRGPEAFMSAAMLYNAATSGLRGSAYPGARAVGSREARRRLSDMAPEGLSGGGVWRDGQILDVNCLHMACLRASLEAGALAANYMEAETLVTDGGRVAGARIVDRLTGDEGRIRARMTLSCTGPAASALAAPHLADTSAFPGFLRATNLVLDRSIGNRAIGVVSRSQSDAVVDRGSRMYFLTPMGDRTIVGTHEASAQSLPKNTADVNDFLDEIASVCPTLAVSKANVIWVHQGLIPADIDDARGSGQRMRRGNILDHSVVGLCGLISVVGVKYTTARLIAERAVDCAARQIDRNLPSSRSMDTPLPVRNYGTPDPFDAASVATRIDRAFSEEMATCLEDVIVRRTQWAETGVVRDQISMELIRSAAQVVDKKLVSDKTCDGLMSHRPIS